MRGFKFLDLTMPFKFQVPTKMVQSFVVEYSPILVIRLLLHCESIKDTYRLSRASLTQSRIGSKIVTGFWLFMFPCP